MADPTPADPADPADPIDPADHGDRSGDEAVVEFGWSDPEVAVMRMDELARRRDGWLNVSPVVEYEEPPPGALAKLFGTRGPMIPVGTWIPGAPTRNGFEPTTVGLQHGMGQRLLFALRDAGQGVPEGWKTLQDHARRGVVLQVPDDTDPAVVLDWIMRVSEIVLPSDPTGRFRATLHRR